jgi:hypothetical protein
MKKILVVLIAIISLTGCKMGEKLTNTPTNKVETYLNSYQSLDSNLLNDLDNLIRDTDYTVDQKASYKELMKTHYKNLVYSIKDETINGDKATVTAEIEVTDYSKIISTEANQEDYLDEEGLYDKELFYDYQLGIMKDTKETVKYTIIFYLTKVNDTWALDDLTEATKEKIHGIYVY